MHEAAIVYANQLSKKGLGYPLWIPEPHTPHTKLRVGDVGWFWEGSFFTLFNATLSTRHRVNRAGVPKDFVPLRFDRAELLRTTKRFLPNMGFLRSDTVKQVNISTGVTLDSLHLPGPGVNAQMTFACNRSKGAMLVLSGKGAKQELLRPNDIFTDYILKHHQSWYELAKRRRYSVRQEDIVMVRGTIKASHWTIASFASETDTKSLTLQVKGGSAAYTGISFVRSVVNAQSVDYRSSRPEVKGLKRLLKSLMRPVSPKDCLFVAQYKVKYRYNLMQRKQLPAVIRAEAYPEDKPPPNEDGYAEGVRVQEASSSDEDGVIDDDYSITQSDFPLDIVLEYILENSSCDVAIASDDDFTILRNFGLNLNPEHRLREELRLTRPRIELTNGRAGRLASNVGCASTVKTSRSIRPCINESPAPSQISNLTTVQNGHNESEMTVRVVVQVPRTKQVSPERIDEYLPVGTKMIQRPGKADHRAMISGVCPME